ncbi:protease modulator HflK [Pseudomonas akapageensis]|uniref:protease modulator HflK n=1 Tax=Pseudomonas akapageensis TaxID=2609961 RepID=UPI001C499D4D|nr:protease modulator HflK [Pseudomonas akapageensis]
MNSIDLDASPGDLAALPRFQHAAWQARRLRLGLIGLAVLFGVLLLMAMAIGLFGPASIGLPLLSLLGASVLLLGGATHSAWRIARWRADVLQPPEIEAQPLEPDAEPLSAYDRFIERIGSTLLTTLRRLGVDALWLVALSVLALLVIDFGWRLDLPATAQNQGAYALAGLALLLGFGLLVLERHLAHASPLQWPEAASLATLIRVVLFGLLLSAFCLFFASADSVWPLRVAVLGNLLPALVALELIVRAVAAVFRPQRATLEPRLIAESLVAGLLTWPPQPLSRLQDELQNRFGIDLRQSWALGFMRRAFVPVLGAVALVGWLLSGLCEVPMNERGIYERFGKPVAVLAPGLHAGLPWPFGQVRSVENGVIHELATSLDTTSAQDLVSADGPAPASANRLWDASHVSEKSQVIASADRSKQSFQVVNMDVRFVYRIGLSDQAALAATYHSADVAALIRSTASRVLVHQFAARTLDDLLGQARIELAANIEKAVQTDLDRLDSGVEVLATVVEAIHPPAGAANAYHSVQAAQIRAQALIAVERGKAAEAAEQSRLQASVLTDQARAASRETLGGAQATERRFDADLQAWHSAGQAFIDEQYFSQLALGLGKAKVLLLDHRLAHAEGPTLDLRTFTAPVDPGQPRR